MCAGRGPRGGGGLKDAFVQPLLHAVDEGSPAVDLVPPARRRGGRPARRLDDLADLGARALDLVEEDLVGLARAAISPRIEAFSSARAIRPWKAKQRPKQPTRAATPAPQPPPLRQRASAMVSETQR